MRFRNCASIAAPVIARLNFSPAEEGLDQEFNTLDALREAAEAFSQSQGPEGWIALLSDDGGFTGALIWET